MGIFEEAKVKEALQIPETESVSALIALGYPEEVAGGSEEKRNRTTVEDCKIKEQASYRKNS